MWQLPRYFSWRVKFEKIPSRTMNLLQLTVLLGSFWVKFVRSYCSHSNCDWYETRLYGEREREKEREREREREHEHEHVPFEVVCKSARSVIFVYKSDLNTLNTTVFNWKSTWFAIFRKVQLGDSLWCNSISSTGCCITYKPLHRIQVLHTSSNKLSSLIKRYNKVSNVAMCLIWFLSGKCSKNSFDMHFLHL